MAPPIALSNVAGTLALSFTAGRAAPASEPPPIQTPTSVPAPPTAPPTTPETPEPPTTTAPETPEPPPTTAPTPTPTPAPTTSSPFIGPVEPAAEDEVEVPTPAITAPRLFRPNTRKLMFSLFVGGSKALRGGYSYGSDFKAEAAFGGFDDHFRVGGFAVVQVNAGFPLNSFTFAPRLALNRQIIPGYAFYFNTNITLGYRLTTYNSGYSSNIGYDGYGYDYDNDDSNVAYHSAVLGVSWGASAIIAERLQLSFRPLDLELVVPAPGLVQINWAAMGGIGVLLGKPTKER